MLQQRFQPFSPCPLHLQASWIKSNPSLRMLIAELWHLKKNTTHFWLKHGVISEWNRCKFIWFSLKTERFLAFNALFPILNRSVLDVGMQTTLSKHQKVSLCVWNWIECVVFSKWLEKNIKRSKCRICSLNGEICIHSGIWVECECLCARPFIFQMCMCKVADGFWRDSSTIEMFAWRIKQYAQSDMLHVLKHLSQWSSVCHERERTKSSIILNMDWDYGWLNIVQKRRTDMDVEDRGGRGRCDKKSMHALWFPMKYRWYAVADSATDACKNYSYDISMCVCLCGCVCVGAN